MIIKKLNELEENEIGVITDRQLDIHNFCVFKQHKKLYIISNYQVKELEIIGSQFIDVLLIATEVKYS